MATAELSAYLAEPAKSPVYGKLGEDEPALGSGEPAAPSAVRGLPVIGRRCLVSLCPLRSGGVPRYQTLWAGARYVQLCFSEHQPGDRGPRRVTQAEIQATFASGWRSTRLSLSASRTD